MRMAPRDRWTRRVRARWSGGVMKIGVLGGGQLGLMLAEAGEPLGLSFRFLDPSPHAPAGRQRELVVAAFDDLDAIGRFTEGLDLVTFEFENVCSRAAEALTRRVAVRPGVRSLAISQDRRIEKEFLQACGIPVPRFEAVSSLEELRTSLQSVGTPAILKTRRLGYDGRGQRRIGGPEEAEAAWEAIGGAACVLEEQVRFRRELSVIVARSLDGLVVAWPPIENRHEGGILRRSLAPAPDLEPTVAGDACGHAIRLAERLGHFGVLALELFEAADGTLLANEFAPRVHNSGHWTIEGSATSQFENHLRAILGWPLGSTESRGVAAMVNLIGACPPTERLLGIGAAKVHLYGKAPREGRKLGHVTIVGSAAEAVSAAGQIEEWQRESPAAAGDPR
jgi:5-(carboxyamino)imidazole ribonucleotide synthase